ncbi:SHOCT domain-containing protein [Natronorubrum sp. FCH18a]|uniref:SHOCT domain-containing protein n=1 Tax=Natronorubrum sp. FCH18a TaxID=3447018 RepID=UPI003F50F7C4
MARLGTLLLKGAGALLLAFVVLSVIATLVSIVLSIVATVVAAVVTLAILAVFVLAAVGLASLFWGGDETPVAADDTTDRSSRSTENEDPADRLRSRYVDGTLSEDEFERELDRLLEDDRGRADGLERDRSRTRESTDRTRLWDR